MVNKFIHTDLLPPLGELERDWFSFLFCKDNYYLIFIKPSYKNGIVLLKMNYFVLYCLKNIAIMQQNYLK